MNRFLPSLSPNGIRWARLFGLTAVALLLLWVVVDLRPVLTPILAALAIAYIINPLVTALERRGYSRLLIVATVYFFGAFLLLISGTFLIAKTIEQAMRLRENINVYCDPATWVAASGPVADIKSAVPISLAWCNELAPLLKSHGLTIANAVVAFLAGLVTNAVNWVTLFVLLPMYAFFFLWRFNEIVRAVRDHLPWSLRDDIVRIFSTADQAIASFFRGRLIVCALIGLCTGLGWTIVGVPFGLPLGALAGMLSLVPFMSVLALPPALLAMYVETSHTGAPWAVPVTLVAAVYGFVQVLESFVFSPIVESKASGLHPLTTVIALMIGGQWAGILGLLLAIPAASTIKALAQIYVMPHVLRLATPADTQDSLDLPAVAEIAAPTDPIEMKAGE